MVIKRRTHNERQEQRWSQQGVVGSALLDTIGKKTRPSPKVRCQQQSKIKENSTKLNQIHHLIISEREMEANQRTKSDKSQNFITWDQHLTKRKHARQKKKKKKIKEGDERNEQTEPFERASMIFF